MAHFTCSVEVSQLVYAHAHLKPSLSVPAVYFSSLLATLNRREDFRGWKRPPEPSKDIELFPLQATGRGRVEFGPETLEQHSGRPLNTSVSVPPPYTMRIAAPPVFKRFFFRRI